MATSPKAQLWCLWVFLIILIPLGGNAQYDFHQGYIVTISNDTIMGQINISNTKQSAKYCLFKSSNEAAPIKYLPSDLISFKVDTLKLYTSKNITVEDRSFDAFLEFLVDGIVDFYYYSDSYAEYYFIESDGKLYQLTIETDIVTIDGKRMKVQRNSYKNILRSAMRSTPDLYQVIDKSSFDPDDFISLCVDFHTLTCPDEKCIVYRRQDSKLNDSKLKVRFGLSGGLALTKSRLRATFNTTDDIPKFIPFQVQRSPAKFLNSTYFSPSNKEITLSGFSLIPVFSISVSRSWTRYFQLDIAYQHIVFSEGPSMTTRRSIATTLIYRQELFFEKKFRPFFNIGFSLVNPIDYRTENYFISYQKPEFKDGLAGEVIYRTVEKEIPDVEVLGRYPDAGYVLGGGFNYHINDRSALICELRFAQSYHKLQATYDSYLTAFLHERVTNWQLMVGVQF